MRVKILVDKYGKVTSATYDGAGSNTADSELIEMACGSKHHHMDREPGPARVGRVCDHSIRTRVTYAEATAWLFQQLPMFQRQGAAAYKADLSGTWRVLDVLGRPDLRLDHVVHVAGTNGKGSVCTAIANALQAQGKRVALFTSPHLEDFRERMRINGAVPEEQWVVEFIQRMRPEVESAGFVPSFFEWTFGMALVWFAEQEVDVVVLETGMGGRLDSTNVFPQPLLTVVTNIADHQQFLGEDIRSIAREKAGIIKDGVPLVMGRMRPEAQSVLLETAMVWRRGPLRGAASKAGEAGPHWPENRATAHKALEVLKATLFGSDWEVPPLEAMTKPGTLAVAVAPSSALRCTHAAGLCAQFGWPAPNVGSD